MKSLGSILFVLGLVAVLVSLGILALMGSSGGEMSFDGFMDMLLVECPTSIRIAMIAGLVAIVVGAICRRIWKSKQDNQN